MVLCASVLSAPTNMNLQIVPSYMHKTTKENMPAMRTYEIVMFEPFVNMMNGLALNRSIVDFCDANEFTPVGFVATGKMLVRTLFSFLHCEWNLGTGRAVVTAKQRGFAAVLTLSAWDSSMQSCENFITKQDVPSDINDNTFFGTYMLWDYTYAFYGALANQPNLNGTITIVKEDKYAVLDALGITSNKGVKAYFILMALLAFSVMVYGIRIFLRTPKKLSWMLVLICIETFIIPIARILRHSYVDPIFYQPYVTTDVAWTIGFIDKPWSAATTLIMVAQWGAITANFKTPKPLHMLAGLFLVGQVSYMTWTAFQIHYFATRDANQVASPNFVELQALADLMNTAYLPNTIISGIAIVAYAAFSVVALCKASKASQSSQNEAMAKTVKNMMKFVLLQCFTNLLTLIGDIGQLLLTTDLENYKWMYPESGSNPAGDGPTKLFVFWEVWYQYISIFGSICTSFLELRAFSSHSSSSSSSSSTGAGAAAGAPSGRDTTKERGR